MGMQWPLSRSGEPFRTSLFRWCEILVANIEKPMTHTFSVAVNGRERTRVQASL